MKLPPDETPEIEPLSDVAWARVERRLFGRLNALPYRDGRPRPRALRVAALMVGAALITGGVLYGMTALVRGRNTPAHDVSRVVTQASATRVSLTGAALEVAPHSALSITGDDAAGLLVFLDSGTVSAEVAPRHGRPPFVVMAGDVQVRVVGTRFSVTRAPEVSVAVQEGVVEVARGAERALVAAGNSWPAQHAEASAPSLAGRDGAPVAVAPTVAAPPPIAAATRRAAHAASPSPSPVPALPSLAAAPATPPPASVAAITPAPSGKLVDHEQEAFESAARLEASNPDGARRGYQALAQGSGPWAANALYAIGRLQAEHQHAAEAKAALGDYLRRFPRGANADDARRLLEQLK